MTVLTFNPQQLTNTPNTKDPSSGCGGGTCGCGGKHQHHDHHQHDGSIYDDDIRIMPTSDDLKRPHSDKELIDEALAEMKRPKNLIASSRQQIPHITVNGITIDPTAIAQEVQYHPANSQEEALYQSAQALVIRELLHQAVLADDKLGQQAWQKDEELAISALIDKHVQPTIPNEDACRQLYDSNPERYVTPPFITARHILLAAPYDAGEERIELKKQALDIIKQLQHSDNRDADFIELARRHSFCPSKEEGGNLGEIIKGQTVAEFEQAVFALPIGVSVNPIETRYGIHIVEILTKKEGIALSYEQAKPMIANQLMQQSFHHALIDYLFALSKQADIDGIELQMSEENVYRG